MPDPNDNKPASALDKLLKGLDALATKLDAIGQRVDEIESRSAPPEDDEAPLTVKGAESPPAPVVNAEEDFPDELVPEGAPAPVAADNSLQAQRLRRARLAAFQARADAVAALTGRRAFPPLEGESVAGYVRRCLREYQALDGAWGKVDLGDLTGKPLRIAADSILAAAATEARNPNPQPGRLVEIRRPDGLGHVTTTFRGHPSVWMSRHAPNRRYVKAIQTKFDS